jgi:D-lactate dehydrogenase
LEQLLLPNRLQIRFLAAGGAVAGPLLASRGSVEGYGSASVSYADGQSRRCSSPGVARPVIDDSFAKGNYSLFRRGIPMFCSLFRPYATMKEMRVAIFSAKPYDRQFLTAANGDGRHELVFFEPRLTAETASLAGGFEAVCAFVNDQIGAPVVRELAAHGIRAIALRSAGFNNVDLDAASENGIAVVRVPAYSPYAVAEHTLALILVLNRKIHRAYNRVREGNFALDGLLGFDLRERTVGIVGTGKIGAVVATLLHGFGCRLLAFDVMPNSECQAMGVEYVDLPRLYAESAVITLHCPLTPETYHLINAAALAQMKPGVMLINTSRGALLDTKAVIAALKRQQIGYLGLDVYEEEADLFFEDMSESVLQDDIFARLLTFPNVVITGHQAFFTAEALEALARTTIANLTMIEDGTPCPNEVKAWPKR